MKARFLTLGLLLVLSGLMVVRTGDFGVRLAGNDDIVPVSYAYYWEYPARFSRDILSTYARDYTLSSLSNWLPALLLRTIDLPPETSAWALLYLQNVLLGLAVWRYTRLATRREGVAWLAVFFAYAAQPWCWNLANYGSKLFAPYPGQLALPILVFAACAVLANRPAWAIGWLALGGLIHPSLTLYVLAIVGLYWLWMARGNPRLLWRLAALVGVAGVCVAPVFYVRLTGGEAVSSAELMRVLTRNLHTFPWRQGATFIASALSFVGSVVLALLGLRYGSGRPVLAGIPLAGRSNDAEGSATRPPQCVAAARQELKPVGDDVQAPTGELLLPVTGSCTGLPLRSRMASAFGELAPWVAATGLACLLFALMQAAGLLFASPLILQLAPLRATLFWPVLTLPLALCYLVEWATQSRFMARWAAVAILLLAAAFVYGLAWGPLVALLLYDLAESRWAGASCTRPRRLRLAGAVVMVLWLAAALLDSVLTGWPLPAMVGVLPTVAASTIQLPGVRLSSMPLAVMIGAAAAAGLAYVVGQSAAIGRAVRRLASAGSKHGFSELARSETGPRQPRSQFALAVLIAVLLGVAVFKAWRMGAETRQPMAMALYQAQRWAHEQTPETAGFIAFGLGSAWRPISVRWTIDPQPTGWYLYAGGKATKAFDDAYLEFYGLGPDADVAAAYHSLDEEGILRLARRFGGDYIVRPVSEPLKFPEVYRNAGYVIYRLTP